MNFKFPLQRLKLQISVTPAQDTVLYFLTGRRFKDLDMQAFVDGRDFKNTHCHVEYFWPGTRAIRKAIHAKN